jgi:kinesin family protein 2/24
VKEIEKIKQKREERRAVQAAIREHVEQEYDTSDPNWEFKAMIKSVLVCCIDCKKKYVLL